MSITAEPSLLQNEVQILSAKPRKYPIGSGGLSDHCRHCAADVGSLALSMAKSH